MVNSGPLSVLPFGGCTVNNPLLNLSKRKLATPIFRQLGFKRTPYSLSPNAALQLLKFCQGDIDIPVELRRCTYVDYENVPDGSHQSLIDSIDLALIEISTPYDILLEGVVLNHNRIQDLIESQLESADTNINKLVNRWKNALLGQKEEMRKKTAAELLPLIDGSTVLAETSRNLLINARCVKVEAEEISTIIGNLKTALNAPLGIVLHTYYYMPDGRPVYWPVQMKDIMDSIGIEQGIPVHNPAELVTEYGTEVALASDFRHWNNDFYPQVADHLYTFMSDIQREKQDLDIAC